MSISAKSPWIEITLFYLSQKALGMESARIRVGMGKCLDTEHHVMLWSLGTLGMWGTRGRGGMGLGGREIGSTQRRQLAVRSIQGVPIWGRMGLQDRGACWGALTVLPWDVVWRQCRGRGSMEMMSGGNGETKNVCLGWDWDEAWGSGGCPFRVGHRRGLWAVRDKSHVHLGWAGPRVWGLWRDAGAACLG